MITEIVMESSPPYSDALLPCPSGRWGGSPDIGNLWVTGWILRKIGQTAGNGRTQS